MTFTGDQIDWLVKESIHNHDEPLQHCAGCHILGLHLESKGKKYSVLLSAGRQQMRLLGGYVRFTRFTTKRGDINTSIASLYVPEKIGLRPGSTKEMKNDYLSDGDEDFK